MTAIAAIAGCLGAALVYALLRIFQVLVLKEPDPALVMWSEHAGFFWRAWTAAYAGGSVAFVAWLFAGRAPERTARFLARAVLPVAAALALQAVAFP